MKQSCFVIYKRFFEVWTWKIVFVSKCLCYLKLNSCECDPFLTSDLTDMLYYDWSDHKHDHTMGLSQFIILFGGSRKVKPLQHITFIRYTCSAPIKCSTFNSTFIHHNNNNATRSWVSHIMTYSIFSCTSIL